LEVDADRGVAKVGGKEIFGVKEEYEAVINELCPYRPSFEAISDKDVEARLGGRLPKRLDAEGKALERRRPRVESIEDDEDIVGRLIFSPKLLEFYGRRFARGASAPEAVRRLRAELCSARQIRKGHTGEYLRLRVQGRFDVVLEQRPIQGDFKLCYVTKLRLPAKSQRLHEAA
jgi:hypothetical protein